jgi:FkbM family methyltransferase
VVQRRAGPREVSKAGAGVIARVPEAWTLVDGLILWADGSDEAIVRPIVEGRYELNELDFVRDAVRPGDAVVDVGAHLGAYTLRLAQLVGPSGHVIAIEPSRAHVECLSQSVADNAFETWTEVVQAAAADVSGRGRLRYPPRGSSTAHAWLATRTDDAEGEHVRTVRLDDLVDGLVRFVKVDAEGAEGLVLRGARAVLEASRPTLLVELHPHLLPLVSGETPASVIAWMTAAGYECRLLGAGRPGPKISDTPSNAVTSAVFLPA